MFHTKFTNSSASFQTRFEKINDVSDGGYERGIAETLAKRTDLVVTENGEYAPGEDSTGFKSVRVNVPNKLAQMAEGSIKELKADDLNNITSLREYAFYIAPIEKVTIPNNLIRIGEYAFSSCSKLRYLNFEENSQLEEIGIRAFYGSREIIGTPLIIPDSVKIIGNYAFYNTNRIETLIIGKSIESIGANAFNACNNLQTVKIKAKTPPSIQSSTFSGGYSPRQYIVPYGSGDLYRQATNWSTYADQIVEGDV